jgi:hypothetical protein
MKSLELEPPAQARGLAGKPLACAAGSNPGERLRLLVDLPNTNNKVDRDQQIAFLENRPALRGGSFHAPCGTMKT